MHDARGVNDLQRFADLVRVVDGVRLANGMFQPLPQAAAGKILEGQIQIVIGSAKIEHVRDGTMIQLGQNCAFLGEALPVSLGNHMLPGNRLDLKGDRLREFIVACKVDACCARLRDLLHHGIAGHFRLPPSIWRSIGGAGRRRLAGRSAAARRCTARRL